MNFTFFLTSALLGISLAMDAFSVSLAGVFSFCQFAMPLIGWLLVHTVSTYFVAFQRFIPWIALALLSFIGGKMLFDGIKHKDGESEAVPVGIAALFVQGIATSIDALSVGFTISGYGVREALVCCLVIAAVTFVLCFAGVYIGKRFGTRIAGKASIFGGIILIAIGIEIFLTGIFG